MKTTTATTAHKWLNIPDDDLGHYNTDDTTATALAIAPLLKEADDQGMLHYWQTEVWPLIPAVMDMQRRGLVLDANAKTQLRRRLRKELAELDAETLARDPTGETAAPTPSYPNSLNSGPKVAKLLFNTLGLKPAKLTDSGSRGAVSQEGLMKVYLGLRKKDAPHRPLLENLFHRSRQPRSIKRQQKPDNGKELSSVSMEEQS